jgi:hypothetical protein
MDDSTANLYYVKAKRESRSKAGMATFSKDGFQRWADTVGVAREEGFTNADFQEEPRVQRKPNMERAQERTPQSVQVVPQVLQPQEQKTGGYGGHEHSRFELEDLGTRQREFLNPQHPEHFSNQSPAVAKAVVAKAKKAFKGEPKAKGGAKQMPQVALKDRRRDYTSVFSSGKDKLTNLEPSTNVAKEKIYKKRPGKTLDLVKEARQEQQSLLGGKLASLKDDSCECEEPKGSGMKYLGKGEEKEGGAKKAKAHASKGKKSARCALVSKIMKERGVKLGEASKIIKAEGLM